MARRWAKIAAGAAACLAIALLIVGALAFSWLRENQRGKQLTEAGKVALQQHDYDGALRAYNAALRCRMSNRNLAIAYASRGAVYLARREFDLAVRDLDEAIKRIPNVAPVIATRASAYLQKGDMDRALADYSKVIELAPNPFSAFFNRGQVFLNRGQADAALADLNEAVRIDPNSAEALLQRGQAYQVKGDLAAAEASFESAIQVDREKPSEQRTHPEEKLAHKRREEGLAADRARDYEQAIALYDQALHYQPSPKLAATIFGNRGSTHTRMRELEKAQQDYDEAIRLDPNLAMAYYNRGNNAREMNQLDAALADFTQVVRLNAQFTPAYLDRGAVFAIKGEFDKASADYDLAIGKLDQIEAKERIPVIEQLARMRATSSKPLLRNGPQAVDLARQACELTQWKNSRSIDTLAAAYAESGDFVAAVKFQSQALVLHDMPEAVRPEMEQRLQLYQQRKPFHHPEK